jgi:zinc D-Ala-D-Ala carboxypeptidase
MKFYAHWKEVNKDEWRWPNFKPEEIACKGSGSILIIPEALDKLQKLRDKIGKPLIINSAYRSPSHNKEVGGSPNSQHLFGIAFDISLQEHNREDLTRAAEDVGFMGVGQYNTFIHVDDRGVKARWDYRGR